MAALVTEDPLLLIGGSGTGKTYLLNTLSESLGLEHRHYNASLISFDDLVGFPYPDAANAGVTFLQTPATVWGAESVLIDEISRCKPEHQNRLFSLVHERRLQGIALTKLRYRWAAMNPSTEQDGAGENYAGSEPLDPALADRFALFVHAGEWKGLTPGERRRVADPGGEGRVAAVDEKLQSQVAAWRLEFDGAIKRCPALILDYVSAVVTALNAAQIRVSPRRARLLARSLLAASIVTGDGTSPLFQLVLVSSLPHIAWGVEPKREHVVAAHQSAWDAATDPARAWIHEFLAESSLADKLNILLTRCTNPDDGTQAVAQFLAHAPQERAAAFAFALYPAAVAGSLPIGAEAVNDLGRIASPMLEVDATLRWQERLAESATTHPEVARFAQVLATLDGARRERALQFFTWCATAPCAVGAPASLEKEIQACVRELAGKVQPCS